MARPFTCQWRKWSFYAKNAKRCNTIYYHDFTTKYGRSMHAASSHLHVVDGSDADLALSLSRRCQCTLTVTPFATGRSTSTILLSNLYSPHVQYSLQSLNRIGWCGESRVVQANWQSEHVPLHGLPSQYSNLSPFPRCSGYPSPTHAMSRAS